MKFHSFIDFFVLFIIIVKIIFVLSSIGHLFLTHKANQTNKTKQIDTKLIYWKERTEFVFIVSMSLLLLYYFRPGQTMLIDTETRFLFFLFGCVLLLTAQWKTFFKTL